MGSVAPLAQLEVDSSYFWLVLIFAFIVLVVAPGAKVVVTGVITSNTVKVKPVLESERNSHV